MKPVKFIPPILESSRVKTLGGWAQLMPGTSARFVWSALIIARISQHFPALFQGEARTALHIITQNSFLEPCLTRKYNRGTAARRRCHLDARRGDTIVARRSSLRCVALRCSRERESLSLKEKELVLDGLLQQQQLLLLLLLCSFLIGRSQTNL